MRLQNAYTKPLIQRCRDIEDILQTASNKVSSNIYIQICVILRWVMNSFEGIFFASWERGPRAVQIGKISGVNT